MLRPAVRIALAGVLMEVPWLALYAVAPLRDNTWKFIALMLVSFAGCLWCYLRLRVPGRREVYLLLGCALLFRLTVLPALPDQSEDVYRYLWDARVAEAGFSPFAFPPEAPELAHLRDGILYPMLNSRPYVTAYPPVSQALFRACYHVFGDSVIAMKAVFGLLEFGFLLLAWALLERWRLPRENLVLAAWNPFFIFEFWHSGHSDSGMMFLGLLAILLLAANRPATAMASYAGAVFSKLHPALWFPLLARRTSWKAQAAGVLVGILLVALYFDPASLLRYVGSLRLYFRLFEFNASIHYLAREVGFRVFDAEWDQKTGPYLLASLVGIAIVIWSRFRVQDAAGILHACFWLMTADLCLATTVHPWYLSWAAFALPLFPYSFMFCWTGAAFLSYVAYSYRPVFEPPWTQLAEYLPVYALMAWEVARRGPMLPALRRLSARAGESSAITPGATLSSRSGRS